MMDRLDSSDSTVHSNHGSTMTRHDDDNLDSSPSSPCPQSEPGEEAHEDPQDRSSVHDVFRSDAPDHGQFDPMSAQSRVSEGQENHCEDLPLVFSFPGHEDDASKVYSCHLCNFRTAFKNSLVNHQAVHSDARPWVCEICDYAAKRKQDLKKHLQTMHGMIVDSLSLQMGSNPQSCVSSSDLSSPTDTKPVLISNAMCGESGSSAPGPSGSRGMNSATHLIPQQTLTGFRQTHASSVMLSPSSRSTSAAGKAKENPFSFRSLQTDDKASNRFTPKSSKDINVTHFKSEFRKESDSGHSSSSDHFFLKKMHGFKEEQILHNCSENIDIKSCRQVDGTNSRNTPSVSKLLPKWDRRNSCSAEEYASVNSTQHQSSPRHPDSAGSEGILRSGTLSSYVTAAPSSAASELSRRQKRVSGNSGDWTPTKAQRFQSPSSESDADCCPPTSSPSERTIISSTVARSRALETNKSFHCVHCDIIFFESAMYLMHAGLHDSVNPWKCSVCGHTFFEKYSFTSHFINQH